MDRSNDDSVDDAERQKSELEKAHEMLEKEIAERKWAEKVNRESEAKLRSLTSQLSLAEERERQQIAAELHDNVGQTLAMMKMTITRLERKASSTEIAETVGKLKDLCVHAIGGVRSLTFELSPPILYALGLEAAVGWLAKKHEEKHGIRVKLHHDKEPKPLADDVKVFLFQAVRELLVNVAKHAEADAIEIFMGRDQKGIRITVTDNGKGFDTSKLKKNCGFGLYNISERLSSVGGSLVMHSESGQGTQTTLLAPLKDGTQ